MDAQFEATLIDCLDALAQGQSVEQVLARYPGDAAQLRPILETAQTLPTLRMQPSEADKMKSRQNFLAQGEALRRTSSRRAAGFLPRFAVGFAAVAVVAIVLGTGAVAASGAALPGDPLYSLKRTVENVRLSTAVSAAARQELQQEFGQRRRDETNELLNTGRASEVEFTGPIVDLQPNAWIVDGLVVQVDANTQIVGTPQIDRLADVHGVTGPNGLRASSITIESSVGIETTPTPAISPTPRPSATPQPTTAPTEITAPATSTPEAPALPTATPRPVVTRTPPPTVTPAPTEVEFEGMVNTIGPTAWNIDSANVLVDGNTEIHNPINVGQRVKVKALRFANSQLLATSIELVESGSGGNGGGGSPPGDNTNHNQNENTNSNTNDNSNTNHNSNDNQREDGNNSNSDNSNLNSNDNNSNSHDN